MDTQTSDILRAEDLDGAKLADIRQRCEDYQADPQASRWGDPADIALQAAHNIPVLLDVIEDLRAHAVHAGNNRVKQAMQEFGRIVAQFGRSWFQGRTAQRH